MSTYLVIARKWRPGLFDEIVGQGHVVRTLRNALSSGRIAHAYLFSGPRGVGKTTAARILAKGLNCENGPTPEPCNTCAMCKGIASGSVIDVQEIDGASNTSVDNVREIRESVKYLPTQGRYKVYIIDEVHMLSGSAFNALLKTLEEPPPHAVFIFATTEVHKIPATILSRCQRFDFRRIPFRELQDRLKKIVTEEGIKFDEQALFTLAREADGSLRDGQSLLEQVLAFAGGELKDADVTEALGLMDRSILHELVEAVISKDGRACLNIVEKIYDFGYDLKRAISDLLELLRDLTVIRTTGDGALLDLPDSELERLGALAGRTGVERLHMLFSIISRGYEEVSRSAFPRYSLEMALLKAAHFDEVEPVSELVSRLEALGSKTGPGEPQVRKEAPAARPAFTPKPAPVKPQAAPVAPQARPVNNDEKAAASAPPPFTHRSAEVEGYIGFAAKKDADVAAALGVAAIALDGDILSICAAGRAGAKLTIKKDILEGLAKDFFKRPVTVKINAGGPGAPAEKKREPDPLVKDALKILGGRVIEERRRSTNV